MDRGDNRREKGGDFAAIVSGALVGLNDFHSGGRQR